MPNEPIQRKLTTILVADVDGFSHLMHEDEEVTFRQFEKDRRVIADLVSSFGGRIFNTGGDSLLAEFTSAVEAVRCAVTFQREIALRTPEGDASAIKFRVGINIGDVMIRGDDLLGDGVNVAARLEGLANPGGICVSGSVYEQVRNKVDFQFQDLGPQTVKNIPEPVSVYRVAFSSPGNPAARPSMARPIKSRFALAAIVISFLIAGFGFWSFQKPNNAPIAPEGTTLALPNKPSIAVLPFTNLGTAPKQELLAEGIVRDIITDLSAFADLLVIASASSFRYKGKSTTIDQVARELGVRFVVDGSIQGTDENVRINIQMADAISGEQLWANRYDRKLKDIFIVQDEITENVVAALGAMEGPIALADKARTREKRQTNLTAYEYTLLARDERNKWSAEGNEKSLELVQKAIALDPLYARAYVEQAWTYFQDVTRYRSWPPKETGQKALKSAQMAIELDETFAEGYWVAGDIYAWLLHRPDKALASYDRALALNPNHADILASWGGWILPNVLNRPDEGIEAVKKAMRLSPFHEDWFNWGQMNAYFMARRFDDAITAYQSIGHPSLGLKLRLVASYAYLGRSKEARQTADEILEKQPDFSVSGYFSASRPYRNYEDLLREGLLMAGLPE